jgi:CPA1 family monovalent cation:H+ antiporter
MPNVEIALALVAIAVVVVAVSALANRIGWSPPLLLVVVGIVFSFVPFLPTYELSPELVLVGILPPLLYSAAYNTSFIDFRANRRALISLSVGLVIFTTLIVGFVAAWLIPGLPLAAGFALGAIVAPPDAIAASAVARRVGMPRTIVQVLEGESLVNDATALTALRSAIVAIGGTLTVLQVGWSFIVAAVGGVLFGVIVAFVYAPIRKRISNPSFETILSFTIPYIAYVPAEHFHASGVLAVVVAGLLVGHKAPLLQSGAARLTAEGNWRTVSFFLEQAVFLLIGLQLRSIVDAVIGDGSSTSMAIWACLGVFVAATIARIVWVFGDGVTTRIRLFNRKRQPYPWSFLAVVSWAGMRGVVTLAAALALPEDVPFRDLLTLIAFFVVVASILLNGSTLPWLVHRLKLKPPDAAEDALQEAALLDEARKAGLQRLDEASVDGDPDEVLARLKIRADERSNAAWERLGRATGAETPIETYQRLRLEMLLAERTAVLAARDDGRAHDDAVRNVIRQLDVEEAMLDRVVDGQVDSARELVAPEGVAQTCEHLAAFANLPEPAPVTPGVCEGCIAEGTTWVHLRMCLACGTVGCCDSSSARHAERHFHETGHPTMRSVEPGEAWRWCYVDEVLG